MARCEKDLGFSKGLEPFIECNTDQQLEYEKKIAVFVSRSDYLIRLGHVKVADCRRSGHAHGVAGDCACLSSRSRF